MNQEKVVDKKIQINLCSSGPAECRPDINNGEWLNGLVPHHCCWFSIIETDKRYMYEK